MKITNKLKNIAIKVMSLLPEKQKYHSYKYTKSVHIARDAEKIIKDMNKNQKITAKVFQQIH